MDYILLKKRELFDKRAFYLALIVSTFANFIILLFFNYISTLVEPPKVPKEPKVSFVKVKNIKIKGLQLPKKPRALKKEKVYKNILSEKKAEVPKPVETKPPQVEQGKTVQRENVVKKQNIELPPKQKSVSTTEKKVISKQTPVSANKQKSNATKLKPKPEVKQPKKVLPPPPPPEESVIDNPSLEPPETPEIVSKKPNLDKLASVDINKQSTSKILGDLKTITPSKKGISFGQPISKYDTQATGTGTSRKIEFMPKPPEIKVRIPIPPKTVKVKIWINKDGTVSKVQLLKKTGNSTLDNAIIRYVKSWKFNKIDKDEIQWTEFSVKFKIQQ